jgi:CheY-like chemotaxis protein
MVPLGRARYRRKKAGNAMVEEPMDDLHVLIVASDADAGELYASALAGLAAAQTIWVRDSTTARGLIGRHIRFDAIVMDVSRPSEWEACEALGRLENTPPLLVITGWNAPDGRFRRRAFEAGCAAFVLKPCDPGLLADIVARVGRGERNITT